MGVLLPVKYSDKIPGCPQNAHSLRHSLFGGAHYPQKGKSSPQKGEFLK